MGTAPEFDWDDANRDHLALHNVTAEEAQQAILDPHAVLLEIQSGDEEERTKALGITSGGRILVVVFHLPQGSHPAGHRIRRCSTPAGTLSEPESDMIQKPIPQFQSEQEEAQWWDEHRGETAEWMEQAVAAGQTTTLSEVLERNRQGAGSTPTGAPVRMRSKAVTM